MSATQSRFANSPRWCMLPRRISQPTATVATVECPLAGHPGTPSLIRAANASIVAAEAPTAWPSFDAIWAYLTTSEAGLKRHLHLVPSKGMSYDYIISTVVHDGRTDYYVGDMAIGYVGTIFGHDNPIFRWTDKTRHSGMASAVRFHDWWLAAKNGLATEYTAYTEEGYQALCAAAQAVFDTKKRNRDIATLSAKLDIPSPTSDREFEVIQTAMQLLTAKDEGKRCSAALAPTGESGRLFRHPMPRHQFVDG